MQLGPDDFLLDHLGGGFDLLLFTESPALPPSLLQAVTEARARGVPLREVVVGAAQPVAGADVALPDADGRCRHTYGVAASGAAYLRRPDQHVCARRLQLDAARLRAALSVALLLPRVQPANLS